MKINELFSLDTTLLVKFMRDAGIVHLQGGGYCLTLTDNNPAVKEIEPSRFEDDGKSEQQPCGHSIWEANEAGECLHGCLVNSKEDKE
jgi:hypothetical protein